MKNIVDLPAMTEGHVDLKALKKEVEEKHAEVAKADTDSATLKKEAGDILLRMKKEVGKDWQGYVKKNLHIQYRTVARYMRIAKHWDLIQKHLHEHKPNGNSDKADICMYSANAVLRTIRKERAKSKAPALPKISKSLSTFTGKVEAVAKGVGVKASGQAIIALMKRLGIPESALVEYLGNLGSATE